MGRWLIDTNILLRLQEEESDEAALAEEALVRLGWNPEDTGNRVDEICNTFELLGDNEYIFPRWLSLVSKYGRQGKQVHDARLVAVMLTYGVSNILTYNFADFKGYKEITAVSPADIVQPAK
jgi:predicted nucleic acid-binding protein